jgi:hypothetical protein
MDPSSWDELHARVESGEYQCVVLGTYSEPRRDVYRAIQAAEGKKKTARSGESTCLSAASRL